MATYCTLALLDAHRDQAERAHAELAGKDLSLPHEFPFLRACVLESLRLWPTTPAILRDTTEETSWPNGTVARGATVLIFAPFFHRDEERFDYADSFQPDLWTEGYAERWPLVPFSAGPVECPGRNLVLLTTSCLLASLIAAQAFHQAEPPTLRSDRPLPATLSPFRLRYR
jgi:cytochrome P450